MTQTPEVYNLSLKEGDKVNRLIQKEFNQVRRDLQKHGTKEIQQKSIFKFTEDWDFPTT